MRWNDLEIDEILWAGIRSTERADAGARSRSGEVTL